MGKRYTVNITLSKELYEFLELKAKEEVRSVASAALFYVVKGIETDKVNTENR